MNPSRGASDEVVDSLGDRRERLVAAAAMPRAGADLRFDGPQQFLPRDMERDLAGLQTVAALAPIGDRLPAEENRVQMRHAQPLPKGDGIGAMAGVHDDLRAKRQHLLFVVALEIILGQVENSNGQDPSFLECPNQRIDHLRLLERQVRGVHGHDRPRRRGNVPTARRDQRRNSSTPASSPGAG